MTGKLVEMGKNAKQAARVLAQVESDQKNQAILRLANLLWLEREEILARNAGDVSTAERNGLSTAMIDRLTLNESRLEGMAHDLRNLAQLPDPIGETFDEKVLKNGLRLTRQRVPLGVLGVIYESRPNVTVDIAGLVIKTGNAAILRGGSETLETNAALIHLIGSALSETGFPQDAVQFIDDPDRARVTEMLNLYEYIDLIIPRGGAGLHKYCRENSRIPVITGGIGICHLYVDSSADLEASLPLIRNAKIQRPTVCNALDTLLVHREVAEAFLPVVVDTLALDGVTFRAAPGAYSVLGGFPRELVKPADANDFDTEWLSLVLGLKIVDQLEDAIEHIQTHSTGHSDGILTQDRKNADRFIKLVDSAAVYVNASTRFTDGTQFGLGAEVAVSTQRLHARGPMGLPELTTYKWIVEGDYHVRV